MSDDLNKGDGQRLEKNHLKEGFHKGNTFPTVSLKPPPPAPKAPPAPPPPPPQSKKK